MAAGLSGTLAGVVGAWGAPPDAPARWALGLAAGLAIAAALGRGRGALGLGPSPVPARRFLAVAAFAAALLSIGYVAHYLRGGPRIVDATTYFLQGRALSEGSISWPIAEPTASFRGRFLIARAEGGGTALAGIFPPGYPLLLAGGFLLGAPMIVGPVLAAAIVVATYRLARALGPALLARELVEPAARTAALASVLCAALRYHTADTMSHGATALLVAIALERAWSARAGRGGALAVGLALGGVAATRPVSALPIGLVALALLARAPRPRALLARAVLGAVPGVLFLVCAQHAATGAWLTSSQRMYYATSDGPPGCFQFGFGAGVGCLHEHGEFVRARLAEGYGIAAAAGTTLRRLRMHLTDVANLEPLALLVLAPLARPFAALRAPLALVGLHVLAYAPFYFDGNYPGGGARFFADVLPVEHALLGIVAIRLARGAPLRAALAALAVGLLGFAVHASFEHLRLAARDGGHPMFEPDVLAAASVSRGLVFVDTDHGFALGHDPRARVEAGLVVARLRDDDRDRLLYEALGRPPTYLYRFDRSGAVEGGLPATVFPWTPPELGPTLRFEAEAEWPALEQAAGFAAPAWTESCASGARALVLTPSGPAPARAVVALPVPAAGRYRIAPRVVRGARVPFADVPEGATAEGALEVGGLRWRWSARGSGCEDLEGLELELSPPSARVTLEAHGAPAALDRLSLEKRP